MPEPVMFIRGFPIEPPTGHQKFLDDLKAIIDLSDDKIDELNKRLTSAKGFLDPKEIRATVRKIIKDVSVAEAVQRIIINISPSHIDQVIKSLKARCNEEGFQFDQGQLEQLKLILKKLIAPYPALARFKKAENLAKITGQQLESVELICDLRPVFDENRENVEGMMPFTRLHIVASGEDGLPKPFEVELTFQQVIDLSEKAKKAKTKLEALRKSVENWLPGGLPDLPLTRIPRKESSDA